MRLSYRTSLLAVTLSACSTVTPPQSTANPSRAAASPAARKPAMATHSRASTATTKLLVDDRLETVPDPHHSVSYRLAEEAMNVEIGCPAQPKSGTITLQLTQSRMVYEEALVFLEGQLIGFQVEISWDVDEPTEEFSPERFRYYRQGKRRFIRMNLSKKGKVLSTKAIGGQDAKRLRRRGGTIMAACDAGGHPALAPLS